MEGTKFGSRWSFWEMTELTESVEPVVVGFDAFYSTGWPEVYRAVAVVIRDRELAREAVDEAMTRAYKSWAKVSAMDNPKGWVYRVAVNWAKSGLRRRSLAANLPVSPPEPFNGPPEIPDPGLVDAVRRLSPNQRDVIVARYVFDMSQDAIAEAFGISRGTVKSRLARGLAQLRKDFSS